MTSTANNRGASTDPCGTLELGPAFEIGLQPAELYFQHSELHLQAIEEEPVVDGVEGRRQVEADQDSDRLVVGHREGPPVVQSLWNVPSCIPTGTG